MASRNWVFTDNNPTDKNPSWPEAVKYASWQLERGQDGTPHLQGYIELRGSRKLAFVKTILPRAHWEQRRGTQAQAREYTRKEDTRIEGPWEYGTYTPVVPSGKADYMALKEAVDNGISDETLWSEHFTAMSRAYRWINEYRLITSPNRDWITNVYLVIGPPGAGKTSFCKRNAPNAYWKQRTGGDNHWWDGYMGQSDVVIDEFYGWIQFDTLLRLIDRYPYMVEIKGGFRKFIAKRLFITSNTEPDTWYPNVPEERWAALRRRFTEFGTRITDFNQNLL